ncbi:hypothetical protein CLOM_g12527 [Closterium sp. NIES-68]|nr:hypothetical protein CLOM_g8006 [Closterium sp. NIES-68]GJP53371.1 hypothetical protein CLOM_g12527 [Closterium sp. NIES-68]
MACIGLPVALLFAAAARFVLTPLGVGSGHMKDHIANLPRVTGSLQVNHQLDHLPTPLAHSTATAICHNGTCLTELHAQDIASAFQHANSFNSMPLHIFYTLVYMAYLTAATLMVLLWWMAATHAQVKASLRQHGLALRAQLLKLNNASLSFMAQIVVPCLHKASMRGVVDGTISDLCSRIDRLEQRRELEEAKRRREQALREGVLEMTIRALGVRLQETMMELLEGERRIAAGVLELQGQLEELAAVKTDLAEQRDKLLKAEEAIVSSHKNNTQIWEAIVSAWGGAPSKWNAVNLRHISWLSDAALASVPTMTQLKSVYLNGSSGFTADGIKYLYRLPHILWLDLRDTDVSDTALEGIGLLSTLEGLVLDDTKVTDAGLLHLTSLSRLLTLGFVGCQDVTSAGMVHIRRLTGLERLFMGRSGVQDDGLQHLTSLTKLKLLRVAPGVTNAGMVHVGTLTSLEMLCLGTSGVKDYWLRHLTSLTRLTLLTVPPGFADAGMNYIKHLTALEKLELQDAHVTEEGVRLLRTLPYLKQVQTNATNLQGWIGEMLPGVIVDSIRLWE